MAKRGLVHMLRDVARVQRLIGTDLQSPIIVPLVLILIAFTAVTLVIVHLYLLDGLDGALWALSFHEDTEYAAGYSDTAFRRIRPGMTAEDVVRLVGPPLEKMQREGEETWRYSRSPSDRGYCLRAVLLRKGRVEDVWHESYVD